MNSVWLCPTLTSATPTKSAPACAPPSRSSTGAPRLRCQLSSASAWSPGGLGWTGRRCIKSLTKLCTSTSGAATRTARRLEPRARRAFLDKEVAVLWGPRDAVAGDHGAVLGPDFFDRDTLAVARALAWDAQAGPASCAARSTSIAA